MTTLLVSGKRTSSFSHGQLYDLPLALMVERDQLIGTDRDILSSKPIHDILGHFEMSHPIGQKNVHERRPAGGCPALDLVDHEEFSITPAPRRECKIRWAAIHCPKHRNSINFGNQVLRGRNTGAAIVGEDPF